MSGKQLESFKVHGNISEIHQSIKIHKTGFIIDADEAWLGASPDAEIICDCCGEGVVEIKCPFKHKDNSLSLVAKTKEFYVKWRNKKYFLLESHPYFSQVQMEMAVTQKSYCDFVVWNPTEIIIIRVKSNSDFINNMRKVARQFWMNLPELLLRRKESEVNDKPNEPTESDEIYCVCKKPSGECSSDEMVACDRCNNWFHPFCLKLKRLPTAKVWYCPACRLLRKRGENA